MEITFGDGGYTFQPWRPEMGRVFDGIFAIDTETTRIDDSRPGRTPTYVLGAAFDGQNGVFLTREHLSAFLQIHRDVPIVFHNAAFDLAVIHALAPEIDIYSRVDQDHIWDTQLLHRLYVLGTEGHTAAGKGQSTLDACVRQYLGLELPKDVADSRGRSVRLSYGQWLGRRPAEIEPVYLEYLAKDTIATWQLHQQLLQHMAGLLSSSADTWGFVSLDWLTDQVRRWGPQTHHIQLKASIVLREITANGLHLDGERREQLMMQLQELSERLRTDLAKHGYLPGKGSSKALQAILKRLEWSHRDLRLARTPTGKYATAEEALQELADVEPFVRLLLEYQATNKLLKTFVAKMATPVLHPSFEVLARTGRTTSFGEINAQNLPRDDRVRSCFVPSPGYVFIDADYSTIELVTLAQACLTQFHFGSQMGDAINQGQDLHRLVAARVTAKDEQAVTKQERDQAKVINFGQTRRHGGCHAAVVRRGRLRHRAGCGSGRGTFASMVRALP
jgi:hypothetical protein